MGGSLRSGSDYMACRECGDKFNLNDPDRQSLPGGRFQPFCRRCAHEKGEDGVASCLGCGDFYPTEDVQMAWHEHVTGQVEPAAVCSQECTQKIVAIGGTQWRECAFGGEHEVLSDYEALEQDFYEEFDDARKSGKATIKKKYIALAAALYITQNYRASAIVDTRLTGPDSDFLPLVITPKHGVADDEYVEQFNRISFPTPVGDCTLRFDQEEQHQAFGVCLFGYDILD